MSCGLFKPETAHEHVLRTGEVVDVGPGKYVSGDSRERTPLGVSPGDGVVFVKFLATHTETAKGIQKYIGEGLAIIQHTDVMLIYDRADAPEFSQ